MKNKKSTVTGEGNAPLAKTKWTVYDSPMLDKVVATFATKREILSYGEEHQINADQIAVTNRDYPHGYVFLGWDEIESF